jgi:hypothetical protein
MNKAQFCSAGTGAAVEPTHRYVNPNEKGILIRRREVGNGLG